jgi:hypothetical protein
MVLPVHALQAVQLRFKSVSNEVHLTFEVKKFFVRISPKVAVGLLSNTTSYSVPIHYNQYMLG